MLIRIDFFNNSHGLRLQFRPASREKTVPALGVAATSNAPSVLSVWKSPYWGIVDARNDHVLPSVHEAMIPLFDVIAISSLPNSRRSLKSPSILFVWHRICHDSPRLMENSIPRDEILSSSPLLLIIGGMLS